MGLQKTNRRIDNEDGSYTVHKVERKELPTLESIDVDDLQIRISDPVPGNNGIYRRVEAHGFTHNDRGGNRYFSTLLGYLRTATMPDGSTLVALDPMLAPRERSNKAGKQVASKSQSKSQSKSGSKSKSTSKSAGSKVDPKPQPVVASDSSDEAEDATF